MLFIAALILVCLVVGFLVGSTGVGGIILIPALTILAGLDTHTAMATALASFIFSAGQVGWLYHRRGLLEFKVLTPLLIGGVVMGFVGAKVKAILMAPVLNVALALLVLLAAVNILMPARAGTFSFAAAGKRLHDGFLMVLGSFVGFIAGLTGVGGPIISIPVMIYFGFTPVCSIAAGQAFATGAALSGTAGNLLYGNIDWGVMALITVAQMVGTVAGVRLACRVPAAVLRRAVAIVCILIGLFLLWQGWSTL